MTRKYTNKILEMYEQGQLSDYFLIQNLLSWMSEADVKEFFENTIVEVEDEA